MKRAFAISFLLITLICAWPCDGQTPPPASPRDALIALENEWLAGEHDPGVLERILAPDFVHALGTGIFADKKEHIEYAIKNLPPSNRHQHFEEMKVRFYGDIGIVNGIVVSEDSTGGEVKTIFTDVFALREGRWQAINAQENKIENRAR
jgi:hypothetical protein